mgnify:CR=1 FL=1
MKEEIKRYPTIQSLTFNSRIPDDKLRELMAHLIAECGFRSDFGFAPRCAALALVRSLRSGRR